MSGDFSSEILVPVDFSESSNRVVEAACALARRTGATLHLLHAYAIPVASTGPGAVVSQQYVDQFVKESKAQLEVLASKRCLGATLGPLLVESGDPRDVIMEQAAKLRVELIVMGTHGRRGVNRALIGSVAENVVRTAPCSVMVVR